jgi:hypothetical protein
LTPCSQARGQRGRLDIIVCCSRTKR